MKLKMEMKDCGGRAAESLAALEHAGEAHLRQSLNHFAPTTSEILNTTEHNRTRLIHLPSL